MKACAWAVVLIAGAGMAFGLVYQDYLESPLTLPDEGLVLVVEKGQSLSSVARELTAAGALATPRWFELHARFTGAAESIQAGEYRIPSGAKPADLLQQLVAGEVILHAFTIVEGWNRWQLMHALAAAPALEHTLTEDDWPAFLAELGTTASSPEGLFLPETYRFPANASDREILTQAFELMNEVLAVAWEARAEGLPLHSPYAALTLASIVEKETAKADERAEIAGVFVRRLDKGMRLQTDPSVIYGIGPHFDGNLTRKDLRTDTPYNTYRRHGLPPTPIAMPGREAIEAALNPADGDTLFFVATGLGDGSHSFSVTKAEHDAAVARYLQRRRERRRSP